MELSTLGTLGPVSALGTGCMRPCDVLVNSPGCTLMTLGIG